MQFLHFRSKILLFSLLLLLPLFIFAFDRNVMVFIKHFQESHFAFYQFLKVLDAITGVMYKASIVGTCLFAVYSLVKKQIGKSLSLTLGIIGVSTVVQIKHLIGRARPKLGFDTFFAGPSLDYLHSSFPSGHTTFVFMFAVVFSHYYPKYRYLFYTFAVWVGLERVEDLAHFPSDVLAGAILGTVVGKLVLFKILPKIRRNGLT